jgi:hypothetical protein
MFCILLLISVFNIYVVQDMYPGYVTERWSTQGKFYKASGMRIALTYTILWCIQPIHTYAHHSYNIFPVYYVIIARQSQHTQEQLV